MRRRPIRRRDDRGETLVEVLVAVAILGLAGVAVVAGLQMSVDASDIHRKHTTGGAYVRSFAEAVEQYVAADHYQPCAAADAYKVDAVLSRLALPSGFSASQDAARSVDATGQPAAGCTSDTGIQQVELHVASSDPDHRSDEQLTILLRRPCTPSVTPCAS